MNPSRDGGARIVAVAALAAVATMAPRVARTADLASVLAQVADRNPAVTAGAARADAARERSRRAGTWEPPMVEFGVVNVPTSLRFDEDPMTMRMIGLRQRFSPRSALERRAGRAAAASAREEARLVRQQALGAAVEAYVAAWSAGERVSAAARHLGLVGRASDAARARYAAGTGGIGDVLNMRSEEGRTRISLVSLRAEERASRVRLSTLRGQAPEFEGETLEPPALAPVPESPTEWLAAVDETNPRLRAADAEVERLRLGARAASAGLWPMIDLSVEYAFRETLAGSGAMGGGDDMVGARVGLGVPLFGLRREPDEMRARVNASLAERRGATLELLEAVAIAHEDARAGAAVASLFADTVLVAGRAALDAAWRDFAAGGMDLLRVLDVAHALYSDELELIRAREQMMAAQGRALALTGRGDLIGLTLPANEERRP